MSEENRSFSVIGHLPKIQSAISIGEDSVRIKMDIPLHNQDQKNKVMCLSNLMDCVFKLTFTIESTNQKNYFYPEQKKPEPMQETQPETEEEVEYQSPDMVEQIKRMRQNIHQELMAGGVELEKARLCKALTGKERLHYCTYEETKKIWAFICNGADTPDVNRTSLRSRVLKLIGGV